MVTSSTLQNLELPYRDNIVVESHGIIIQNDQLDGPGGEPLIYPNSSKHAKLAMEILEQFRLEKIEIMSNPYKQEVLDKINVLKDKSDKFEQNRQPQTVFLIAIIWVGFKIDASVH